MNRICKKCNQTYPLTSEFFQPRNDRPGLFRLECRKCKNKYRQLWGKKNYAYVLQKNREWAKANPEIGRKRHRAWRANNLIAVQKEREQNKQWYKENAAWARAKTAARRNAYNHPISLLFKEEILKIYKACPPGYHVDHIIPLKGKNVCGLHVPHNLQYLTQEENLKKSNKAP